MSNFQIEEEVEMGRAITSLLCLSNLWFVLPAENDFWLHFARKFLDASG